MTLEEAAEIILKNEPFIDCINCNGVGWCSCTTSYTQMKRCPSCRGRKKQLLLEHEIACRVLGLEIP